MNSSVEGFQCSSNDVLAFWFVKKFTCTQGGFTLCPLRKCFLES